MDAPWKNATYLIEQNPLYDRWDRRWRCLTRRLDAFRPSQDPSDAVMLAVLIEGVKTAEVLRNDAALVERWDLDPAALARLMRIQTWDAATIAHWLGLSLRQVRRMLRDDGPIPKEALVTAVVPLALPMVEDRRKRAWILTVAEVVAATG